MSAIVANCAINLRCELTKPVKVEYIDGNMFSMDNAGNTAHVYIYYNGQPQEVVGSVSAEVIRPDGGTVAVTGAMSGNRAYVIFPQAVYAIPGTISCVIKITEGTTTTTIAAFVANVYRSSTDQAIDPGQLIPSISSLISAIETAVGSIPADYSSLLATIAGTYSSSKTYNVGDYAWESGVLKRCIVPITAGETFTAAHWTNAVVCDDLSALKSALVIEKEVTPTWESGTINTNGVNQNSTTRIRSNMHIFTGGFTATIPSGMKMSTRVYKLDGTYESWGDWKTGTARFELTESKRYRFVAAYSDDSTVAATAGSGIEIKEDKYTDPSLTMSEKAADAKAVGDALEDIQEVLDEVPVNRGVISSGSYAISDFTDVGWYIIYAAVTLSDRPDQFPSGGFFLRVSKTGTVIEQEILPFDYPLYAHRVIGKPWNVPTTNQYTGKTISIIGDSISDKSNSTAAVRYYDVVDAELGTTSTEYAMSGCGYKRKYNNGDAFYEQAAKISTTTDLVLIFGSFNDHNVYDTDGLGNVTDTTTDTVFGCVYATLQAIFTRAPKAAVGIILPTPWSQYPPYETGTLQWEYVNGIKEIAKRYSVPVLDLYSESNMRPWDSTFRVNFYKENDVQDSGTHPNSAGHRRFAPQVVEFAKKLLQQT